ncbi:MAG: hypothetical protein IPG56_06460 [Caulobacteraceae bacterium]|nr:hypothetical protein [Caulobacteraceae bacterium]
MNRREIILGGAALAACSPEAQSQAPVAPFPMRRGVNLGNALEAPNEGDWGPTASGAMGGHCRAVDARDPAFWRRDEIVSMRWAGQVRSTCTLRAADQRAAADALAVGAWRPSGPCEPFNEPNGTGAALCARDV